MADAVIVEGLADLQKAFNKADRVLATSLRATLREVGEPVRADAEVLAVQSIRRIGIPWSRMRIGTTLHSVYVAPRERGLKTRGADPRRRPNLAPLLLGRSMEPALAQNRQEIIDGFDSLIHLSELAWERA